MYAITQKVADSYCSLSPTHQYLAYVVYLGEHWLVRRAAQKTATYRIPRFFQLAAMVPIGGAIQISTLLRTAGAIGTRMCLTVRQWPDSWPLGLSTARSRRNAACRFSYVTTMSTKPLGC